MYRPLPQATVGIFLMHFFHILCLFVMYRYVMLSYIHIVLQHIMKCIVDENHILGSLVVDILYNAFIVCTGGIALLLRLQWLKNYTTVMVWITTCGSCLTWFCYGCIAMTQYLISCDQRIIYFHVK